MRMNREKNIIKLIIITVIIMKTMIKKTKQKDGPDLLISRIF